jgi:hypothetical protein
MEYRLHGANTSFQNFEMQSKQFSYLWQRRAATDRGESFPSFDGFLARPDTGTGWQRWSHSTRERSRFYWNGTAVHVAGGRWPRAVLAAARSILWNPRSVAHRLYRNYLRPRALTLRPVAQWSLRRAPDSRALNQGTPGSPDG